MAEVLPPELQATTLAELCARIPDEFKQPEFTQFLTTHGFPNPARLTSSTNYADIVTAVFEDARRAGRIRSLLAALYYAREGTDFGDLATKLGRQYPGKGRFESLVVDVDATFDWYDFMERSPIISRHVCLLSIDNVAAGTGVLVGPDLVLTSHHVVNRLINADGQSIVGSQHRLTATFDFMSTLQPDGLRTINPGIVVAVAQKWLEASSLPHPSEIAGQYPDDALNPIVELDYALIRLAQQIGNQQAPGRGATRSWAALKCPARPLGRLQRVHISQHAAGQPLRGATGRISAVPPHKARVRYSASTLNISSGSPCWNNDLQLIALHNFGGEGLENQGVPIDRIIADLATIAGAKAIVLPHPSGGVGPVPTADTPRIWSIGGNYPVLGRLPLLKALASMVTAGCGGSQVLVVNGNRHSGRTFTLKIIQQFLQPAGHTAVAVEAAALIDDTPESMFAALRAALGLGEPPVVPGAALTTRPAEIGRHKLGAFLAQIRERYPAARRAGAQTTQLWIIFDGLDQVPLADETHDLISEITRKVGEVPNLRIVLSGYEHPLPSEVELTAETEQIAPPTVKDVELHLQHALEEKLGFVSPEDLRRLATDVIANASTDSAIWLGDVARRVRDIVRSATRQDAA